MAFGIQYIKPSPTTYVIQFRDGAAKRSGVGLSFFYFRPASTIVMVPLSSVDVPFVFNEVSADFQSITIQGQLTYRVIDPPKLAQLLDFSVHPNGRYISDDPRKLGERLVSHTQVLTSAITHKLTLRQCLVAHDTLSSEVFKSLEASARVQSLGVEVMDFAINSLKPSPETSKALETETREALLREADEAVYARRNSAVELERKIRESELNTEMLVQEKNRQIREAKMTADIAMEEKRGTLLERKVANERQEADSKAYALNAVLEPIKGMDWRSLTAVSAGRMDPKLTIAMAFRDLAENATKIGELNISPELLGTLLKPDAESKR